MGQLSTDAVTLSITSKSDQVKTKAWIMLRMTVVICVALVLFMNSIDVLGAPQNHGMGPCENGPCAALFGPCVEDTDCMGGNVCVDDMDTCMNMISPCCQMVPEGSGSEAEE